MIELYRKEKIYYIYERQTMRGKIVPINIFWDEEAHVWVAIGEGIGLALESGSYDALIQRVRYAAPEMAAENGILCLGIKFKTQNRQVALV